MTSMPPAASSATSTLTSTHACEPPRPGLAAAQVATPAAGPDAEYQAAFNQLKEGRYDEAAAAFTKFLANHHDHELASNAQYWIGEVHYVKREYPRGTRGI